MALRKVALVPSSQDWLSLYLDSSSVTSYFTLRFVIIDGNEPGTIYILGELVYWIN